MKNWKLMPVPTMQGNCQCCGKPTRLVSGDVKDDHGRPVAAYVAVLTDHSPQRIVPLHIILAGDAHAQLTRSGVAIMLVAKEEGIGSSVVTATEDPTGRLMTMEEALASPLLPLFFEIDDFILANDRRILPFLLAN